MFACTLMSLNSRFTFRCFQFVVHRTRNYGKYRERKMILKKVDALETTCAIFTTIYLSTLFGIQLPFSVPLGCGITVDLHPYDGDGDYVTCTWNNPLPGATLDKAIPCLVTLTLATLKQADIIPM